MGKIIVLNGPNLNLLGLREPDHYGRRSLAEITRELQNSASAEGMVLEARQTNHEGVMLDWIHELTPADFLIINPGAWTHTSYALRDAIAGVKVPAVEIHLSNIHAREEFRRHSLTAPVCLGQISGLGEKGYFLALMYAVNYLKQLAIKEPD